jgi:hypothetical protein
MEGGAGKVERSAGGGARTHTILRSLDFESSASASSATPAGEGYRFAPDAVRASEIAAGFASLVLLILILLLIF